MKPILLSPVSPKSTRVFKITCGDITIGSIKRNSETQWILYGELPNYSTFEIVTSPEAAIGIIETKLKDFIAAISE